MAEDPVENLEGEIPSLPFPLDLFQEPDTLDIVTKTAQAMLQGKLGEKSLSVMAEGAVPDIVAQGDCLNEIFVQGKKPAAGSSDLGNKLHVQNPVGNVVILDQVKDLGLVYVSGIGV
jgi:hypothetical protein